MNHRHQSGGAGGVSDSNLCHRNYRIEARIWTRWLNSRSGVDRGKRQTKESKMTIALNVILFFLFFSLSLSLSFIFVSFWLCFVCGSAKCWPLRCSGVDLKQNRAERRPGNRVTCPHCFLADWSLKPKHGSLTRSELRCDIGRVLIRFN